MTTDAIERLRDFAINKWTDGIGVKDAREILAEFEAMKAQLGAAIAELADLQEKIDELRENEIWRKIYND
jgi:hypothetical protein